MKKNVTLKFSKSVHCLTNVFDFVGYFSNYVGFDESKWFCGFTKYTTHKFATMPQSMSMG